MKLTGHHYGKSAVRLTKVRRLPDRHELVELNVTVRLGGEFERSYTHGDNGKIVATDSMKNTVYLLAKTHPIETPESFAAHLAEHFVERYSQVSSADVEIEQSTWDRIVVDGKAHPTAFEMGSEVRDAQAMVGRRGPTMVYGGLSELMVLKTTDSAFSGFVRDEFTTLPEATDRILATKVSASWRYAAGADFAGAFDAIRKAMLDTFANHKSLAVQQTLYDMAVAALNAAPGIDHIELTMPNKHRIPFNFSALGAKFENDIFVTTDEPSGEIVGSVSRGDL